jgi:hypothetical protein
VVWVGGCNNAGVGVYLCVMHVCKPLCKQLAVYFSKRRNRPLCTVSLSQCMCVCVCVCVCVFVCMCVCVCRVKMCVRRF